VKNFNLLKFYRVKDWIKNPGITLLGILISENLNINILKGFIALLLSSFLLAYAFSLNNYCDWNFSKERNYISRLKTKKRNKLILVSIPLIISFLVVLIFFLYEIMMIISFLLFVILYTFYSFPPRLKKNWKFSLFINAFCLGMLLLFIGYFSQTSNPKWGLFVFSFIYFSYLLTSEILHQISHIRKDKRAKIKSFPVLFGIRKSIQLIQLVQFIVVGFFGTLITVSQKILLLPSIVIIFSILRIFRVKKIKHHNDAYRLRNKLYGIHEGIFYLFLLVINFLLAFRLTTYLY
jgi:4-hydroxybenzoate polyprenyltransferase